LKLFNPEYQRHQRNTIIGNFDTSDVNINKIPILNIENLKECVTALKITLENDLKTTLDVGLYGELVQHKTASVKKDIYNYKEKNFIENNVVVFGAIIFNTASCVLNKKNIWTIFERDENIFIHFDSFVIDFLSKFNINTVPILKPSSLYDIFENMSDVVDKKLEGYVISNNNIIFKIKNTFENPKDDLKSLVIKDFFRQLPITQQTITIFKMFDDFSDPNEITTKKTYKEQRINCLIQHIQSGFSQNNFNFDDKSNRKKIFNTLREKIKNDDINNDYSDKLINKFLNEELNKKFKCQSN
jgi:hypothetical protein